MNVFRMEMMGYLIKNIDATVMSGINSVINYAIKRITLA
jgi:hypothetical protein